MRISKLSLRNFRSYTSLSLSFEDNINIFIGDNAQGKTNILEAIFLGAIGRSHRTTSDSDMIQWNEQAAAVDILFHRKDIENKLSFKLKQEESKEVLLNNYPVKLKEIIGSVNIVLFSPEDLWLIKGPPSQRRRFLDIEISQASPTYYRTLLQYNRILNQRNHLLKKIRERKASLALLESWDEQLAKTAEFIVIKRLEAIKKLSMLANLMQRKLTNSKENLTLIYSQANQEEEVEPPDLYSWYIKAFTELREQDILRGSTSIGPHRDDIVLKINEKDVKNFGSQGQQRTGILALKLAELEFLKSETGEYPVLLMDDVMSELDIQRREQLLLFIHERIQTFITATDSALFPDIHVGHFYHVNASTITE
ncbi:MAG: recF [Firmicutes bacterium]|nr:recF [Bacillota bacterium]